MARINRGARLYTGSGMDFNSSYGNSGPSGRESVPSAAKNRGRTAKKRTLDEQEAACKRFEEETPEQRTARLKREREERDAARRRKIGAGRSHKRKERLDGVESYEQKKHTKIVHSDELKALLHKRASMLHDAGIKHPIHPFDLGLVLGSPIWIDGYDEAAVMDMTATSIRLKTSGDDIALDFPACIHEGIIQRAGIDVSRVRPLK